MHNNIKDKPAGDLLALLYLIGYSFTPWGTDYNGGDVSVTPVCRQLQPAKSAVANVELFFS